MRSEQLRPRSIRHESIERYGRGASAVNYVANSVSSSQLKTLYDIVVTVATTHNIALTTATTTVDGIALSGTTTVLVHQQTTASENGVYSYNDGAWSKLDVLKPSVFVRVQKGVQFADAVFILAYPDLTTNDEYTDVVFKRIDSANSADNAVAEANANTNAIVAELYDKVLCLINEKAPVYIVARCEGMPAEDGVFGGAADTFHAIPFETIIYNPSEGTITIGSDGGFQYSPARAGYYHVDVYYKDDLTSPTGNVWLKLYGDVEMDRCDIPTDKLRLQGSQIIYVEPPNFISAGLVHNAVGLMYFNNTALDQHGSGYISIHYCGDTLAATNV